MTDEHQKYIDPEALIRGLEDRPEAESSEEISALVGRLCEFYQTLKAEQSKQIPVYRPGGEWIEYIGHRAHIYKDWLDGNVPGASETLRNFWRNELGIVQQYAGYSGLVEKAEVRDRFVEQMAYDFVVWENLFGDDPRRLEVPHIGNPWGYVVSDVLVAPKALRYHLMSKQVASLVSDRSRPIVAEIGGGYGGMAYYLLKNKTDVTYIDLDLPEVLMIAAYYLSRAFPDKKVLLWESGVEFDPETLGSYDVILAPNWMLPELPDAGVDLFYNTFSLSEMPRDVVTEYISQIERAASGYFLHNNMDRHGVIQYGHERLPCSEYPISADRMKLVYRHYDRFQRLHQGRDGDYREELYEVVHKAAK
jgi:hypothetical protein